jgi:hypothetical protein
MKKAIGKRGEVFSKIDTPLKIVLFLIITTVLGTVTGFLINSKILLPILVSLSGYLFMIYLVKSQRRREAVIYMLLWAFILGVVMTIACYIFPQKSADLIINGTKYNNEMFSWIKTGVGREGTPSQFIPQHLLHLSLFVILSIVTMSSVSILFGAILMNYMSFYVAQLMLAAPNKLIMFILGWHFWSLFRITGFVILGVVLSEILARKVFKYKWKFTDIKNYILIVTILIFADIVSKTIFAPSIGRLVKSILKI